MSRLDKMKVGIVLGVFIFSAMVPLTASESGKVDVEPVMNYGLSCFYMDMDPHRSCDSASSDMIEQVMEGLFAYDLQDPNLKYQPCLAADYGIWEEGAEGFHGKQWKYTVDLKTGIKFHDGTTFGPEDVKFSFDRLNTLCTTEILGSINQMAPLYMPLASTYPVTPLLINATNIVDEDTVEIILNYKYAALESLLCFTGSVIMPLNKYSPRQYMYKTEILIGTGPYKHISGDDEKIVFEYFEEFRGAYGQKDPDIRKMTFQLYDYFNKTGENQDFLNGDIDAIGDLDFNMMEQFENSSSFKVGDLYDSAVIRYFAFDMNLLDINTRKALRSAINYTNILIEYGKGEWNAMTSLVPKGILYHDETIEAPTLNLVAARASIIAAVEAGEKMLSKPAGWAALKESTKDSDWEAITIATLDYVYYEGGDCYSTPVVQLKADFAKIGISLNVQGLYWNSYLSALNSSELEVYEIEWRPDYNDPSQYFEILTGKASDYNRGHMNDTILDNLITQGLKETDPEKRESLYKEMQQRILDLSVFAFIATTRARFDHQVESQTSRIPGRSVYKVGCQDTVRNALGILYFYMWDWTIGANYYKTGFGVIPSFNTLSLIAICTISLSIILHQKQH